MIMEFFLHTVYLPQKVITKYLHKTNSNPSQMISAMRQASCAYPASPSTTFTTAQSLSELTIRHVPNAAVPSFAGAPAFATIPASPAIPLTTGPLATKIASACLRELDDMKTDHKRYTEQQLKVAVKRALQILWITADDAVLQYAALQSIAIQAGKKCCAKVLGRTKYKGFAHIMCAMRRHPDDFEVQAWGMYAMSNSIRNTSASVFAKKIAHLAPKIRAAMASAKAAHPESEDVFVYARQLVIELNLKKC